MGRARLWGIAMAIAAMFPSGMALAQGRPVIERIDPTSGPSGVEVSIVGRNLHGDTRARIGDVALRVVRVLPHRVQVVIGEDVESGPIVIETAGGTFRGPHFRVLAGRPAPAIESVEPASGPPGSEVTLVGHHFSPRLSDNSVSLGDVRCVVRSATPTRLVVVVPTGVATAPFQVAVSGAGEAQSDPFTVADAVAVAALEPERGPPGSQVRIVGTGFGDAEEPVRVSFGRRRMAVVSVAPNEIHATVPAGSGSSPLIVEVRGAGRAESPRPFTIQAAPRIASFSPAAATPGTRVTIRGEGFGDDVRAVRVMVGARAMQVRRVTPTEIHADIPPDAEDGPIEVRVHGLVATAEGELDVLVPVAVTGFAPTSGPVGTEVTLRGRGFSQTPSDNRVRLSGVEAEVIGATATELRVRIPSAAGGPFVVAVENNGEARTSRAFVVTQPPVVLGFEPTLGPIGTEVTLRGRGFGTERQLLSVQLGGRPVRLRSVADDRIVVVVPTGAATGPFTVSHRMQGSVESGEPFRVVEPFALRAVRPPSAFAGRAVTVAGSGFVPGATVTFEGAGPATPVAIDDRAIRVVVPPTARTGAVAVQLPTGETQTLPRAIVVGPIPPGVAILDVEPACSRRGCEVVLRGYGFEPSPARNRVTVQGRRARVVAASPTALRVRAPRLRGQVRFDVEVTGRGRATSEATEIPDAS
jgi:hypothetical protein